MKTTRRRILVVAAVVASLAAALVAFLPDRVAVETAPAVRGPLRVTVDEEGETRARDRFTVAAPVAGRLERVQLEEGDAVARDQVVARLYLVPLDPRERVQAEGRLLTAQALQREAEEIAQRAQADADQARRDRERAAALQQQGYIALQAFEQARSAETAAARAAEAARFKVKAAAAEVQVARAGLMATETSGAGEARVLGLRAPTPGRVLRVLEKSERVVAAGTPIMEIGDPALLEVVVDVLSSDAVRIRPGMPVLLEGWGGDRTLEAVVRTVEPAAFTKVSALGIEEQRVKVVADFAVPQQPGTASNATILLGDGYRVEAKIVVWSAGQVLKVPASAPFRQGKAWAVFTVVGERARLAPVEAGQRTPAEVEILKGLAEGDRVVVHPPNGLEDGARVKER
jgi:HlyD family secretion protein